MDKSKPVTTTTTITTPSFYDQAHSNIETILGMNMSGSIAKNEAHARRMASKYSVFGATFLPGDTAETVASKGATKTPASSSAATKAAAAAAAAGQPGPALQAITSDDDDDATPSAASSSSSAAAKKAKTSSKREAAAAKQKAADDAAAEKQKELTKNKDKAKSERTDLKAKATGPVTKFVKLDEPKVVTLNAWMPDSARKLVLGKVSGKGKPKTDEEPIQYTLQLYREKDLSGADWITPWVSETEVYRITQFTLTRDEYSPEYFITTSSRKVMHIEGSDQLVYGCTLNDWIKSFQDIEKFKQLPYGAHICNAKDATPLFTQKGIQAFVQFLVDAQKAYSLNVRSARVVEKDEIDVASEAADEPSTPASTSTKASKKRKANESGSETDTAAAATAAAATAEKSNKKLRTVAAVVITPPSAPAAAAAAATPTTTASPIATAAGVASVVKTGATVSQALEVEGEEEEVVAATPIATTTAPVAAQAKEVNYDEY